MQPHTDPLVTVAIRSDGSVESLNFVRSSGVPAIDDAIRRIVDSQAPYQAFPPGLASQFDVVEIRRDKKCVDVVTAVEQRIRLVAGDLVVAAKSAQGIDT